MYTVKKIMCKSTELQIVLFRKAFLSDCVNTHLKNFRQGQNFVTINY